MTRLISYDIDSSQVNKIKKTVKDDLTELKLDITPVDYEPHVTVAMIELKPSEDALIKLQEASKNFNVSFKYSHMELLEGSQDKDYVVIKLKASSGFYQYLELISDEVKVKTFPGGAKPHISLFTIPKGSASKRIQERIKGIKISGSFSPKKVQLWGENQQIQREIPIKKGTEMKKAKDVTAEMLDLENRIYAKGTPSNTISLDNRIVKASSKNDKIWLTNKIITASDILKSGATSKDKLDALSKVISDLEKRIA